MIPLVSYVIPIHNEEAILHAAVVDLRERLREHGFTYEIWLAENGSRDATREIAEQIAQKLSEVHVFSIGEPNYGRALREGIGRTRGTFVICEEIDLCDVDFHVRALELLQKDAADLVVGSKLLSGARDQRPMLRHVASLGYNGLLRSLLGFQGTDTHGLKAFRREALLPVVARCIVDKDVFASELVIRAYRDAIRVIEIPVRVVEKRTPSINLFSRVPNVVKNLWKLTYAIRIKG